MDYIGKTVRFQHRVATGKAGLKHVGSGVRLQVPVPTELETVDALVLNRYSLAEGEEPHVTLIYENGVAMAGADWQSCVSVAHDVPHQSHPDAEGEQFWFVPDSGAETKKLGAFLLANFKSETGDETPEACAIRLLTKMKAKK